MNDVILGVLFTALGLGSLIWGAVTAWRHARLKSRGTRATAVLTQVRRQRIGRGENFYATAEWRDENGQKRTGKIVSAGDYLIRHLNKEGASDEILYNERHVILVNDKRNRTNAILMILFGVLICVCGVGTLIKETDLLYFLSRS